MTAVPLSVTVLSTWNLDARNPAGEVGVPLATRGSDLADCCTKQEPPGTTRGLSFTRQGPAYRLTWRLAPPLGPRPGAPGMSPLETSLTHSEPLPL